MKYKINEIFYSLQGEGYWVGTPMIFIRFSGCNLNCSFCDTDHSKYEEMTIEQIMKKIEEYKGKKVCLTGGEPTLQIDRQLLEELSEEYTLHLESNGFKWVGYEWVDRGYIEWITLSPKTEIDLKWFNCVNELKIVYQGQDVSRYLCLVHSFTKLYLQPCSMKNIKETIKYVKENPEWQLSIQMHKLIGVR